MAKVYVVGTMDTKGEELRFAAECVRRAGAAPVLVDVGTKGPAGPAPTWPRRRSPRTIRTARAPCWASTTAARRWAAWRRR